MSAEGRTRPQFADRTRKARLMSACALCPALIRIGNPIGRLPGRGWAHVACILAGRDDRSHVPGSPPGTH